MSSLNPPEARPTFATHVPLNATQAIHSLSGKALFIATVASAIVIGSCIIPAAALTGVAFLGILGVAGITALKSVFTFVAAKWALGMAGIVGLFYLTHLPLFGRYLWTVSKLKTMIEEKTGEQLEVNYGRLATQLFGLKYIASSFGAPDTRRAMDLLSYQGIHFYSLDKSEPGLFEIHATNEGGFQSYPIHDVENHLHKAFIMAMTELREDPEFKSLSEAARDHMNAAAV